MLLSGQSPDGRLVEIVELKDHPWFVASQFHPEFKCRPERPHPLFDGFVGRRSLAVATGASRTCAPAPAAPSGHAAGRGRRRSTRAPPVAELDVRGRCASDVTAPAGASDGSSVLGRRIRGPSTEHARTARQEPAR